MKLKSELMFKLNVVDERIKLELWSVIFGSLIIDVLTVYAGSFFWLFISGLIFGSMSRRLTDDFIICGTTALLASAIALYFFHLNLVSVYSFPFQLRGLGVASPLTMMAISFLLGGSGGYAGSYAIVRYVRKKYGYEVKTSREY